jgi:hypothetical protein
MLRHVVVFRWNSSTTDDDVARLSAGLDELPALVPQLRSYTHGSDVRIGEGSWDYAVVADFDDAEGWRAYDAHPRHEEVRAELIRPHLAERAIVRFNV